MTRNGGSGTIELAGGSATSGTYTMSNVRIDVAGTISGGGLSIPFDFADLDQDVLTSGNGTWRVLAGNQIELTPNEAGEDPDTIGYSVTGSGLFLVSGDTIAPGQVLTAVVAFKR